MVKIDRTFGMGFLNPSLSTFGNILFFESNRARMRENLDLAISAEGRMI